MICKLGTSDLVSIEVKYHVPCYKHYTRSLYKSDKVMDEKNNDTTGNESDSDDSSESDSEGIIMIYSMIKSSC